MQTNETFIVATTNQTSLNITQQNTSQVLPLFYNINVLLHFSLILLNFTIMVFSYFLLIFQSIYILNSKQPKYINLRHIAIKWLVCYILQQIKRGYLQNHEIGFMSQIMVCVISLTIFGIVYPSRALKTIHLRYFAHKQQQKYKNSVSDPHTYDITFGMRLLTTFIIFLLGLVKHLIAFVPPNYRKSIQQPICDVNKVMFQRKYFWSIYQDHKQNQQMLEKHQRAMLECLLPKNLQLSAILHNASTKPQVSYDTKQNSIHVYAEQCSIHTMKPIKKVSLKYTALNSELEIMDLDFYRSEIYMLEEVIQKQQNMVEFKVIQPSTGNHTQQQTILIKFGNMNQVEMFMKSLEQVQSST